MPKRKKKIGDEGLGLAAPAGGGIAAKAKPMLLGAVLVMAGGLGQRYVLANPPAEVIIAPPSEAAAGGSHTTESVLDCSGYVRGFEDAAAPHAREASGAAGATSDLPSMTINLADGHYLKAGISLQLGASVDAAAFKATQARAADVVLNYFSNKSMDELGNERHSAIKSELTCLIDAAYATEGQDVATVDGVLFREFLTS